MDFLPIFWNRHKKIILLFVSAVLFALDGWASAWVVALPLFFLVKHISFRTAWLYGGAYGILSSVMYAAWLFKFSVPAMLCVWLLYFILYAFLFEVLVAARILGGRFAWIFYAASFVLFEFLKTRGFLGFGYGVNGYTQYRNLYLMQIADVFGVFGVSAVLYLSSAVAYEVLDSIFSRRFGKRELFILIFFHVLLASCYVYGFVKVSLVDSRDSAMKKIRVAAVQHNTNPNEGGFSSYASDVRSLMEITDLALAENPGISLVVWPETAVVPSILSNYENARSPERRNLVEELLLYMDSKDSAFVVGNFHSEGGSDYNSAYFFIPGKNVLPPEPGVYRKIHLVPFSEHLPFAEKFPRVKNYINGKNNFLWTPGSERTVFSLPLEDGEFRFSTPICFEDTFGADLRKFRKNGALAFVNLSNDAWSRSRRCQVQHLKMAVFRSVENHVPSVRSTASGETCVVSSSGRIVARSRPFEKNYVVAEIPVLD